MRLILHYFKTCILKGRGVHYERYRLLRTRKDEVMDLVLGQIKLEDLDQERLEVRKSVEKKSTTKKPVEKKSVSAAKTEIKAAEATEETTAVTEEPEVVEAVVEEPKVEEPAAEKETKTTRTRKTTAKKEEKEPKAKTTSKAPATKKEEKEAEPKTRAKSVAKAPATEKVVLQVGGREDLVMGNLIDRVKAAYVAEGHKADSIKSIEVYVKIHENMAYYVIDGYASGISLY